MLRFFRQIRQRLLTDNKFSKYLLYAIGEILLVVIGIMIALQIDNWNEQRKDSVKEKEYLTLLTLELKTEIQYLKNLKEEFETTEKSLKRIRNQWQSGNSTIRDSIQYIRDFASMGFISPWYIEPVTWTLLQQTGDLSLIRDNDLKNELFVYNSTLKKTADNYLQFPMEMVKQVRREMDMPFINDNKTMDFINPVILDPSIDLDRKEIFHHGEVFNQIWAYRMNLLPLAVALSNVSSAQQLLLAAVLERGEQLLINLNAYQSRAAG
jgi:hypothetical protein